MNLRTRFELALVLRGEMNVTQMHRTNQYTVFTRKEGGFYFLGASGAVRYGPNASSSRACSEKFKAHLLQSLDDPE